MTLPAFATDGCPIIVGGGLAGLLTAIHLAPEPCIVLNHAPFGTEAASLWAQGGIAAAVGPDDDPGQHLADTLAAGDGLCDAAAAARIIHAGPDAIDDLSRLGAAFDRDERGVLRLGREAAHTRHRIVHASGDGTGREIMRAVLATARALPSIRLLAGIAARRLLVEDGRLAGLLASGPDGAMLLATSRLVLATGGLSGLYDHGTGPRGSWGAGLALAVRAGAAVRDMEFVQFHPTALDIGGARLPLVSEAVRGDGAVLVDEAGTRILAGVPGEDLAPRDIVARALWRHRAAGHRTFLDARAALGAGFKARFPSIAGACTAAGIDPTREPIPVRPAAHYGMGGVAVDRHGRSTLPGLWACGEVASTGLHGANRLASNSLLEAVVCARWVAADIGGLPHGRGRTPSAAALPPESDPAAIRPILSHAAGIERRGDVLAEAVSTLFDLSERGGPAADPAVVGLLIAMAGFERQESRGAHFRVDAPTRDPAAARSRTLTLTDVNVRAQRLSLADT